MQIVNQWFSWRVPSFSKLFILQLNVCSAGARMYPQQCWPGNTAAYVIVITRARGMYGIHCTEARGRKSGLRAECNKCHASRVHNYSISRSQGYHSYQASKQRSHPLLTTKTLFVLTMKLPSRFTYQTSYGCGFSSLFAMGVVQATGTARHTRGIGRMQKRLTKA